MPGISKKELKFIELLNAGEAPEDAYNQSYRKRDSHEARIRAMALLRDSRITSKLSSHLPWALHMRSRGMMEKCVEDLYKIAEESAKSGKSLTMMRAVEQLSKLCAWDGTYGQQPLYLDKTKSVKEYVEQLKRLLSDRVITPEDARALLDIVKVGEVATLQEKIDNALVKEEDLKSHAADPISQLYQSEKTL